MTITAERLAAFIWSNYILPANKRGEGIVMIPVRRVWTTLDNEFPLELIRAVLGSTWFCNIYQLTLVPGKGSTEHCPETYVFKLHYPGRAVGKVTDFFPLTAPAADAAPPNSK